MCCSDGHKGKPQTNNDRFPINVKWGIQGGCDCPGTIGYCCGTATRADGKCDRCREYCPDEKAQFQKELSRMHGMTGMLEYLNRVNRTRHETVRSMVTELMPDETGMVDLLAKMNASITADEPLTDFVKGLTPGEAIFVLLVAMETP